ncbi:MAG: DUF4115 domain-containing protein [Cyanobacteriota/Melainabacteria group bacterium]|nr:helix-turn-helix domain-containing protein [Cyanobacteria bacterium HKST-UBA01]MCB9471017.1 helix-turn-helix domain-containing protein [Candidatus Obscuribacterales bacterium]
MSVFEQIGQKLKAARESRGLSLGQIYDKTKISTANLEAIESGDIDQLPEPVYVSGFIKRYAECVGLNGQNLVAEYRQAFDDYEDRSEKSHFGGFRSKGVAVQQAPIVQTSLTKAKLAPPKPSFAKLVFYPAFLIVIIVGLISYLFYYQQMQYKSQRDPSIVALEQTTSRYSPASVADSSSKEDGKGDSTGAGEKKAATGDTSITLNASRHVWVEVKSLDSGNSLFTGFLEAGDQRVFQDAQGLKVRAGNGGSLNVSFQGKHETFGQNGVRTDRTFQTGSGEASGDGAGASDTADRVEGEAKPAPRTVSAPKPVVPKKVVKTPSKPKPTQYRNLNASPSRYIPGESLGGSRSIGVPYRYTEGRLDSE